MNTWPDDDVTCVRITEEDPLLIGSGAATFRARTNIVNGREDRVFFRMHRTIASRMSGNYSDGEGLKRGTLLEFFFYCFNDLRTVILGWEMIEKVPLIEV